MKKTAMQLLIEWMDGKAITHESVRLKATELLETERQDHEKTYTDAFVNSDGTRLEVDFDEYYKDTYE